ncbi:MAG: aspartyl protease family protein [Chitinophagia bacterium]
MKTLFLHIVALLMLLQSVAQEQFVEPYSKYITTVPFQLLTGGVILLKAKVNDFPDSLNFILDTGSGGISLDSTTVAELKIPVKPSDKTIRGVGGLRNVSFLYDATLKLPGVTTSNLNFHVNDYGLLSNVYGIRIDGIIGYSFFSKYIVNLNYDNLIMTVYTIGEYKYPSGGHLLRPMFTALPIQQVEFKDNEKYSQYFYFDTGAGLNFLISESYANDSAVLRKRRKPLFVTQAEGVGGKTTMQITTVKRVKIGPYRFYHVPTFLFKDIYNVTNYPFVGGLLGNDMLRRFNVTFNYVRQQIHLVPNSHYRDLFDYAYSGLSLYYVDGKIIVDDVVPGSPSEKAGLKKDDIILGVGSDLSNNLQQYKTLLQEAGKKINLLVSRPSGVSMISMKPVNIR